jgi:hypothetical protein
MCEISKKYMLYSTLSEVFYKAPGQGSTGNFQNAWSSENFNEAKTFWNDYGGRYTDIIHVPLDWDGNIENILTRKTGVELSEERDRDARAERWDDLPIKPVVSTVKEVSTDSKKDQPFLMIDFLNKLEETHPFEVLHVHSYPIVGYGGTTGFEDGHNPQLLMPIAVVNPIDDDAVDWKSRDWNTQYKEFVRNAPLPGWERGVTNLVVFNKKRGFVPMFDMTGQFYNSKEQLRRAFGTMFAEKGYLDKAYVFATGRSFHVYVPDIVSATEWNDLLIDSLMNVDPNESFHVDRRWVGHSLKEGFTAIRVSNFSKQTVVPYAVFGPGIESKPIEPELPF